MAHSTFYPLDRGNLAFVASVDARQQRIASQPEFSAVAVLERDREQSELTRSWH